MAIAGGRMRRWAWRDGERAPSARADAARPSARALDATPLPSTAGARALRPLTVLALVGALLPLGPAAASHAAPLDAPLAQPLAAAPATQTPSEAPSAGSSPSLPTAQDSVTSVPSAAGEQAAATGDVIVRFTSGSAAATSSAARDRALDAAARAASVAGPTSTGSDAGGHLELDADRVLGTGATLVTGADPAEAADVARALQARADVAYAEPDVRLRPSLAPDDPLYADYQWDLSSPTVGIGVERAWATTQGAGVTVAVVDSGIVAHPDLAGRVLPGYDFISDARTARDGDGRDADPSDRGDWTTDGDCGGDERGAASTWHGTHIAGTIAAVAGNRIGIAGIAPRASILPVRAIGRCGGKLSDIADGLTWASGGAVRGAPKNTRPARVVNVSLGGVMACPTTLQSAIDGARSRGAVVVTAAGNSGIDAAREAPGNCSGVINVAATTGSGGRATYSNNGSAVTLSAPGGQGARDGILSTIDRGPQGPQGPDYGFMVGTSMAAPHVSAVAALMLSADPTLTPAQVRSLLVATARPFPQSCAGCGAGLLDAGAAVARVRAAVAARTAKTGSTTTGSTTTGTTTTGTTTDGTTTDGPGGTTAVTPTALAAPVPATRPLPARITTDPTPAAEPAWSAPRHAPTTVRYAVQSRPITVVSGRRSYGAWTTVTAATAATTIRLLGAPGSVHQFRVRAFAPGATTSPWSAPATVAIPADVTSRSATWRGAWVTTAQSGALGGSVLRTRARGASATLPTTYTSGVAIVAPVGPDGGTFDVYVDGRRAQRVTTTARRAATATTVAVVRVPYGRHSVRLVRVSGTVALDGIAHLR